MSAVADMLAASALCAGLSLQERAIIAGHLRVRCYSAGQPVFHQGDPGTEMYIVSKGRVASLTKDKDGSERGIYTFTTGRFFGEMSIIDNVPRSASCTALEDSELLVMTGNDFYGLIAEHPAIAVRMLSHMASVMAGWLDEASGFLGDLVRWGETARRRAVSDRLTGLFNRRFLEDAMRGRLSGSGTRVAHCGLLMLDIDHFHSINERFGAAAGDMVIGTAGQAFGRLVRDGDVAARLSGDEFAFFLPDAGIDEAMALAERIRLEASGLVIECRKADAGISESLGLSVSIGAAASPRHADGPESLMAAADKALFQAKAAGRNCVVAAG